MDVLTSHTLVMPTYNRADLVLRLVDFCARSAPEMPVLVLDSSADAIKAQNAAALPARHPNLRHIAYANDIPMARKLARGLEEVQTATASFCADDDVIFPEALAEAIGVLQSEPGTVCAHGLYLNFREDPHAVHLSLEYSGPSLVARHPGARIFYLMQDYESLFYGVFRIGDLRRIMTAAADCSSLHFQELTQSVAALILGDVRRTGSFYAARRSGPEAEPGRERWQTYYWFADDTFEFLTHYAEYRDQIFAYYEANADRHGAALPRVEFDRAMDLSHSVYFSRNCPPPYFFSRLQHLWPDDPFIEPWRDAEKPEDAAPTAAPPPPAPSFVERLRRRAARLGLHNTGVMARLTQAADSASQLVRTPDERIAELNAWIAERHPAAWKAAFAAEFADLPETPGFREAYDRLCDYLDGPVPPTG